MLDWRKRRERSPDYRRAAVTRQACARWRQTPPHPPAAENHRRPKFVDMESDRAEEVRDAGAMRSRRQRRPAAVPADWALGLSRPVPGGLWGSAGGDASRGVYSRGPPRSAPPVGTSSPERSGLECSADGGRVLARREDAPWHRGDDGRGSAWDPIHRSQCRGVFGVRRPPRGGIDSHGDGCTHVWLRHDHRWVPPTLPTFLGGRQDLTIGGSQWWLLGFGAGASGGETVNLWHSSNAGGPGIWWLAVATG